MYDIIPFTLSKPTELHRLLTHAGAPSRPSSSEEKHKRITFPQEPTQAQGVSLEIVTIKSAARQEYQQRRKAAN